MEYKMKFYLWAIDNLRRRRMTLKELAGEWARSYVNDEHRALTRRTFFRYRNDMLSLFGIEIECDTADGNRYCIRDGEYEDNETMNWLLSALRISSLAGQMRQHENVMLEPPPRNAELLKDFLYAIEHHYAVSFHYATPFGKEFDTKFIPAFVRLFRQRWYVIGQRTEDGEVRTLAFDRMTGLSVVEKRHTLSRSLAKELRLRPTRDFRQQLLWHGRKIIVLEPVALRDEMVQILSEMRESYLTKEDMSGD